MVAVDGFFEWKKFEVMGQTRRQAYFVVPEVSHAHSRPEHSVAVPDVTRI